MVRLAVGIPDKGFTLLHSVEVTAERVIAAELFPLFCGGRSVVASQCTQNGVDGLVLGLSYSDFAFSQESVN